MRCAECGADEPAGVSCWEQLLTVLAWEQDDPALAALHFVTVATHNLQHPSKFEPAALEGLREVFAAYLEGDLGIGEVRIRVGREAAGARRVMVPAQERRILPGTWDLTIADVYAPDRRPDAAERVRRWARSVRATLR